MTFLRDRQTIELTRPMAAPESANRSRAGDLPCDEPLFQRLRELRKKIADERNVPAYVIFSDVALRHMAREYPETPETFGRIPGVGERKRDEFAAFFTAEISAHLSNSDRQSFPDPPSGTRFQRAPAPRDRSLTDSVSHTAELFAQGKSIEEIASIRNLAITTIQSHLAKAVEAGADLRPELFYTEAEVEKMAAAFAAAGWEALAPVKELVGEEIDYGKLHLYRAFALRETQPVSE